MSLRGVLVTVALASSLAACGGAADTATPEETEDKAAPTAESTTAATTASPTPAAAPQGQTCKDAGGDGAPLDLMTVQVDRKGEEVTITWTAKESTPATGTVLYSLTASNLDGNGTRQYGVKYQDGEQVGYFAFDFGDAKQENLKGEIATGTTVKATFPATDLGESFRYSATTNVEGNDVDRCPNGEKQVTFRE